MSCPYEGPPLELPMRQNWEDLPPPPWPARSGHQVVWWEAPCRVASTASWARSLLKSWSLHVDGRDLKLFVEKQMKFSATQPWPVAWTWRSQLVCKLPEAIVNNHEQPAMQPPCELLSARIAWSCWVDWAKRTGAFEMHGRPLTLASLGKSFHVPSGLAGEEWLPRVSWEPWLVPIKSLINLTTPIAYNHGYLPVEDAHPRREQQFCKLQASCDWCMSRKRFTNMHTHGSLMSY